MLGQRERGLIFIFIAISLVGIFFTVPQRQVVIGGLRVKPSTEYSLVALTPSCVTLPSTQKRKSPNKWVISYGLYGGESPRYVAAIKKTVAVHSKALFPEWTVRIYYDTSISQKTKQFLLDNGAELIPGPKDVRNKMCWRFLSAIDPEVERFISRDADSFLSLREKWAVDEWVKSGKKFHNMRDHPSGGHYTMMGGMWGAVRGAVTGFEPVLKGDGRQNYLADMDLINRHVWPMLLKDALQHDAFTCNSPKYHDNKPFPYPRIGWEIIGGVVIDPETGATRPGDIDLIARATPPAACIPPTKPLTLVDDLFNNPRVERQCSWSLEPLEEQDIPGCPSSYGSVCSPQPQGPPCQMHLVRIKDVFVDWDTGEGYGTMFDAETAFTPYPLKKLPPSLFERNSTGLLERVKYFSRLAHVLLPHCESSWTFAALVLPRLRLILQQLPASVPVLLVRNPIAEEMIPLLSHIDGFDPSRVIWHSGAGHLYYAHEMWFILSSCQALPISLSFNPSSSPSSSSTNNSSSSSASSSASSPSSTSSPWVVSCGDLRPQADLVLNDDTPVKAAMDAVSTATTFVCWQGSPWLSFVQFLRPGAAVVEVGHSDLPVLVELARRKHVAYSFEPR